MSSKGEKLYKSPSELKNFWMTTQTDEKNFSSWCYDVSVDAASKVMSSISQSIKSQ